MKRHARFFRVFAGLAVLLLLFGLATPTLRAEFECKQELMAGAWVTYGNLNGQTIFAPGPWSATGMVVFDDLGFATTAVQTNTTSLTPNGVVSENFLERFELRFTINPDCTARYTFHNVVPGHPAEGKLIFALDAVCGNGQHDCYATFTETPPPENTDPVGIIGVWHMKKVEPSDHRLEQQVDALSMKMDAIMRRMGIFTPTFGKAQ